MQFNGIIFPSPKNFNIPLKEYSDELIFIPRNNAKLKLEKKKSKILENFKNHKHNPLIERGSDNYSPNMDSKINMNYELLNEDEIEDNPCNYIPILLLANKKAFNNFCIFFHCNAEDIFLARDFGEKLKESLQMNIILVEYPGYSIYFDQKSPEKVLENSLLVFDFLIEEIGVNHQNIIVMGRSIGTAPATYLASKRFCSSLILISAFTSIRSLAERLIGRFLKYLIIERFENINYIKDVFCPTLFIHGLNDDMIPYTHTIKLKDESKAPFEVILPEDMDHNNFDFSEHLINPLKSFLRRHTKINDVDNIQITEVNSSLTISTKLFLIPNCILKKIKQIDEDFHKPSVFSCFGL